MPNASRDPHSSAGYDALSEMLPVHSLEAAPGNGCASRLLSVNNIDDTRAVVRPTASHGENFTERGDQSPMSWLGRQREMLCL